MENFVADWTTLTESDIAAVPNPGGTGGAAPAFTTNFDFTSVLEPDGVTVGLNNQVTRTSSGLDLAGSAAGDVGYDRLYRVFPAATFGNGIGNFNIEWEYAYWDGMARGTGYVILGLANSTAARFYNGAGKGITPIPTGGPGWDILVDDSAGLWLGEDGSGATVVGGGGGAITDLVAAGLPARTDGTFYFCSLAWDDTAKTLTYSEYTDATRAVLVASAVVTPATPATFTTLVCTVNENQIKTRFSGRDQSCQFRNLNLNLVKGPAATLNADLGGVSVAATATVETPVVRYYTQTILNDDGTPAANGIRTYAIDAQGNKPTDYGLLLTYATTSTHPSNHPTHAGQPGFVIYIANGPLTKMGDFHLLVLDQAGTVGAESGVSSTLLTPQLTASGNG